MADYILIVLDDLTLKQVTDLTGSERMHITQNGVDYAINTSSVINKIINNLLSDDSTAQLSAAQGKVLKLLKVRFSGCL